MRLEVVEIEELPSPQADVWLLLYGGGVIDNGGFQYFFEGEDPPAMELAAALERIGAKTGAKAIRTALGCSPGGQVHKSYAQRVEELLDLAADEDFGGFDGEFEAGYWATRPLIADYIRLHERAFVDLPEPSVEPVRHIDDPDRDADHRTVAAWLQEKSSSVILLGTCYPDGRPMILGPGCDLPDGELTLLGVQFAQTRRDLDATLEFLSVWKGRSSIRRIALVEVWAYLTESGLRALRGFQQLDQLELKDCGITDSSIATLRGCDELRELDLTGNEEITDASIRWLAEHIPLTGLRVGDTSVGGRTLGDLSGLHRLVIGASLDDRSLSFLEKMPQLLELDLLYPTLDRNAVAAIGRASQLQELTLWCSDLTELDLEPLAEHPSLRKLNISGIEISTAGASILGRIRGLCWLMVGSTNAAARRVLEKLCPDVELTLS